MKKEETREYRIKKSLITFTIFQIFEWLNKGSMRLAGHVARKGDQRNLYEI
jgi:hypothetical protein